MRSPWTLSRQEFLGIAASAALLVVFVLGAGVACGTYAARTTFASTAAVRNIELFSDEPPTVRVQPIWTSAAGRTVHALLAEPIAPDVEPPFELDSWPRPGEFLVSADLLSDRDALEARFGRLAGTLPEEALPSAHSRVVLARPIVPIGDEWLAAGFGVNGPNQQMAINATGFFLDDRVGLPVALAGIGLVGVVPAGILLSTSLGAVRRRHARTGRVLEALGVSPWRLHAAAFRAICPALAAGSALVAAVLVMAAFVDVPVPFADFALRAIDVRREPTIYWAAWLTGSLLAGAIGLTATRPSPLVPHNRFFVRTRSPLRPWLAVAGVASVALLSQVTVSEASAAMTSGQDRGTILWLIGGSLIALGLMPAMVAETLGGLGRMLSASGREAGRAVTLLVGRGLQESPGAVRIATAGSALIVIAGLAATWALMGSIPAVQARQIVAQIDGAFVTVSAPRGVTVPADQIDLPTGTSALALVQEWRETDTGEMEAYATIVGSHEDLAHWGLQNGKTLDASELPGELALAVPSGDATHVEVRDGTTPTSADGEVRPTYIAFNDDGSQVDRDAVQRALSSAGGPGWSVSVGGETWLIGAADLAHDLRWIGWFAVVGGSLLVGALLMRTVHDQREQILTGAAIDALFSKHPLLPRLLAIRIGIVAAVTAFLGGGTALAFARVTNRDLTTTGGSAPVIIVICCAFLITIVLVATPQISRLRRLGRDWRPGGTNA